MFLFVPRQTEHSLIKEVLIWGKKETRENCFLKINFAGLWSSSSGRAPA
jgi:hypothetical protein